MIKPLSITAMLGLITAVTALVMAGTAVYGYRAADLHFVTAIKNFEWAAYTAGGAMILSFAGLWIVRPNATHRGLLLGLIGLILSLPLVIFILNFEYAARAYPPINDITTDTQDPPTFWDVPYPVTYPGDQVAELQRQGYPNLKHLEVAMDPDQVFKLASIVARDMGWEIVANNISDMQIEAVARSFIFGFEDYVLIRLQDNNGHTRVDMRSHSRLGRIDRGTNAKHIRTYFHALKQQVEKNVK